MRAWFSKAAAAARFEVAWVLSHPKEWLAAVAAPLVWCLMLIAAFGDGLMTQIPVGYTDADRSAASREVIETLSALPSVRLVPFADVAAAERALKTASVYGVVTIPENFEADRRRGTGSPVVLQINKLYYAVGTILEVDLKTALMNLKAAETAVQLTRGGGTFAENARRLRLSMPEVYFLGNPAFNFSAYLLPTLVPGVMALGALLGFVASLVREWREGRVTAWLAAARGSATAAVAGKLTPWIAVWFLAGGVWVAGFAGAAGWGVAGSLSVWFLGTALLMLSMAALALFAASLAPSWVIAVSACICLVAPTFPFTGFSFPLDAMSPGAQLFGVFLPLTHYLELQAGVWVLDAPAAVLIKQLGLLALFPLVMGGVGLPMLVRRMHGWVKKEAVPVSAVADTSGNSFLSVMGQTARHAFFSKDTIAVFAGAVAFYLIFYGWPYSGQQVENIPTGIVDLDRSAASRNYVETLTAAPAVSERFIVHDAAEGLAAFRRGDVDVLVTVPGDYEKRLARGENASVHILGNGAYPVKTRAVQGAAGAAASDTEARFALASVMNPGTPSSMSASAKLAGPAMTVIYRYNEISGYGNYTVPMVGPVIVQAVILFGVSVALGNWLVLNRRERWMAAVAKHPVKRSLAMFLTFWLIALAWFLYMQGFDFSFGEYGAMANPPATFLVAFTFTAAVTALAMALATVTGAGWTAPLTVSLSAPSLFISGAVWPLENMSPVVQGVAQLLPSTPGIPASAAAAQAGAATVDVLPACLQMTLLAVMYLVVTLWRLRRVEERK